MDATSAQIAAEVLRAIASGSRVFVATIIFGPDDAAIGAKMLVHPNGTTLGALGVEALDAAVLREALDTVPRSGVAALYFNATGEPLQRRDATGGYELMIEVHERPARLVIVGGGHVGKACSLIGEMCGFRVTVIDDRPEWANPERFPEADEVIRGRFDEVLTEYPIDGSTYVICVTRGHRHDETSLRCVIGRGAAYVGMIGSKRRAAAVLKHLVDEGADAAAVAGVHTPIGLDIGAETPEEIAVAILGEIISIRRKQLPHG
ncbi:MAG: XdhC/CoxI family protein [Chloroflexota bacterium]